MRGSGLTFSTSIERIAQTAAVAVLLAVPAYSKRFQVDGLVIEVDAPGRSLLVAHRPIEGYMPAMVMPFRVEKSNELDGVHPGTRVHFEMVLKKGGSLARKIEVVASEGLDLPKPEAMLPIGAPVPDFALTDQSSRAVRLSDLRGKVVLLNFIYTRCPVAEACPRLGANFANLQRRFRAALSKDLVLLSLTLDPRYDTPDVLSAYARRWRADPDGWRFLTGPPEAVRDVASRFGVLYWPENGILIHGVSMAVIGRDGRLASLVSGAGHRLDQLVPLVSRELEVAR